jgi:hypothetical protein
MIQESMMKHRLSTACLAALLASAGLFSQGLFAQNTQAAAQCILAGRLDSDQRWAPQVRGMVLLDAAGQPVRGAGVQALSAVKSVRVSQPALLSSCNGNQSLQAGDASTGQKSPAPAVSASPTPIPVQAINFPPLRVGGSLVELQLQLPSDRVIVLTR